MFGVLFIVGVFLIFISILTLVLQFKHLLNILLRLEAITLGIFTLLFYSSINVGFEGFICLVIISLSICEASIGLAILVALIRTHGNDYVSSFNSYKC